MECPYSHELNFASSGIQTWDLWSNALWKQAYSNMLKILPQKKKMKIFR